MPTNLIARLESWTLVYPINSPRTCTSLTTIMAGRAAERQCPLPSNFRLILYSVKVISHYQDTNKSTWFSYRYIRPMTRIWFYWLVGVRLRTVERDPNMVCTTVVDVTY